MRLPLLELTSLVEPLTLARKTRAQWELTEELGVFVKE